MENSARPALKVIGEILLSRGERIAVAESVTAGYLQALFSDAPEATRFFEGGITTYNARQKVRQLHIEPITALRSNCVSDQVACDMAIGVSHLFRSDWGIGITGYATPIPEAGIKTLFAFYACAYQDQVVHAGRIDAHHDDSKAVQMFYARAVIDGLTRCLKAPSVAAHAS